MHLARGEVFAARIAKGCVERAHLPLQRRPFDFVKQNAFFEGRQQIDDPTVAGGIRRVAAKRARRNGVQRGGRIADKRNPLVRGFMSGEGQRQLANVALAAVSSCSALGFHQPHAPHHHHDRQATGRNQQIAQRKPRATVPHPVAHIAS